MYRALNNLWEIQRGHDCWVTEIEFTDDIVILLKEPVTVLAVLDRILREAVAIGLEINTSKIKFSTSQDQSHYIHINKKSLGPVGHANYPDFTIQRNNHARDAVCFRV